MSRMLHKEFVAEKAVVHSTAPISPRGFFDQTFELPGRLFATSLALFTAFLVVMTLGFGNPGLIIPMAIFGAFYAGFFGIPALFVREAPKQSRKGLQWHEFKGEGLQTHTGHLPAGEAAVQMLLLPMLIVVWAIACVTIAALV